MDLDAPVSMSTFIFVPSANSPVTSPDLEIGKDPAVQKGD